MRIVFINKAEKPASSGSIYPDVIAALENRGVTVDNVVPESALFDMTNLDTSADLYVLRTRTVVGLNLAAALDVAGAKLLIPYENERVLRNKFLLHQKLIENDIPTPRSYLVWKREQVATLFAERGVLVVKPHEGHGGSGVQIVRSADDVEALGDLEGPLFVQEFKEGTGTDVKLYGVGTWVAGIRRIFPAKTPEEKRGTPLDVSGAYADIALACDRVLGLGLYGVDLLETSEGPFVIDINSLPGYKGIDGAADKVAEYIYERAGGEAGATEAAQ